MKELLNDDIYTILQNQYSELLLDYTLLTFDEDYHGVESHKKAVITALSIFNSRVRVGNSLTHPQFYVNEDKMSCIECCAQDFFYEGNNGWTITSETTKFRKTPYKMNYWLAFSQPPYGLPYSSQDFRKINYILFPNQFRKDLKIYSWNDDFSNYFDDGKEWWGTALWSIYDRWMNRFIIVGASLTD